MKDSRSSKYAHQREFSLPGDPDAIPPVVEAVRAFLREVNCHVEDESAIALALQEGLSNAVVHGCGKDPEKRVLCSANCAVNGNLVIVIRDPGVGFDPTCLSSPLTREGLVQDHGRGIYLMRHLMDEVRFEANGTQLVLRKI